MNDATLDSFRRIADAMAEARNEGPADWAWNGPHVSQCMYGITQARAEAYAARHGGTAYKMTDETIFGVEADLAAAKLIDRE